MEREKHHVTASPAVVINGQQEENRRKKQDKGEKEKEEAAKERERRRKRARARKKETDQISMDTKRHGVKFYDKKGSGRIKQGKKIYD